MKKIFVIGGLLSLGMIISGAILFFNAFSVFLRFFLGGPLESSDLLGAPLLIFSVLVLAFLILTRHWNSLEYRKQFGSQELNGDNFISFFSGFFLGIKKVSRRAAAIGLLLGVIMVIRAVEQLSRCGIGSCSDDSILSSIIVVLFLGVVAGGLFMTIRLLKLENKNGNHSSTLGIWIGGLFGGIFIAALVLFVVIMGAATLAFS